MNDVAMVLVAVLLPPLLSIYARASVCVCCTVIVESYKFWSGALFGKINVNSSFPYDEHSNDALCTQNGMHVSLTVARSLLLSLCFSFSSEQYSFNGNQKKSGSNGTTEQSVGISFKSFILLIKLANFVYKKKRKERRTIKSSVQLYDSNDP